MPSKAMVIIGVLFAVTLVTAVVGYAIYYSYAGVLSELARSQPSLYELLQSFKRLEYRASSPDEGDLTVILANDPARGRLEITVTAANGTRIAVYTVDYGPEGVVSASRFDPATGEEKLVTPSEMERILLNPVEFTTSQAQAGLPQVAGVRVSPGLGPLVMPYTITAELSVDWRRAASPWATVNIGFTEAEYAGSTLRGMAVTITPQTRLPTSPWTQATIIAMVLAEVEGLPAAVQASVVAGQDRVDITLVSIER